MSIQAALDKLLGAEGVYSDHPADRGGETFCGIARHYWPVWPGWSAIDRMKEQGRAVGRTPILDELVRDFYTANFWAPLGCDRMASDLLAYEVFEAGVNCSVHQSGVFLQDALNLLNRNGKDWPELKLDGRVGPTTLSVVGKALGQPRGEASLVLLHNRLQACYYIELARRSSTQEVFLRGWLERTR